MSNNNEKTHDHEIDLRRIARYDWLLSTCDMSCISKLAFETIYCSPYLDCLLAASKGLAGYVQGVFVNWAENIYTLDRPDMSPDVADYVGSHREAEAQLEAMSELQAARLIETLREATNDQSVHWSEYYRKMQA